MASLFAKRWYAVAQFVKSKDYVFKNRSTAVPDIIKLTTGFFCGSVLLGFLIEEFGYPTPDIIYDIKMLVSEDFRSFHRYGGHGPMIMRDATGIRGYHTNVENASVPEPPLNQKNIPLG